MAVVLLLVVGSALVAAAPASAAPTSCYHGWRQSAIATHHYAWGKCYAGSGYYQVAATCYVYPSTYVVRGPWVKRVYNSEESRVACPSGVKPSGTWVTVKN